MMAKKGRNLPLDVRKLSANKNLSIDVKKLSANKNLSIDVKKLSTNRNLPLDVKKLSSSLVYRPNSSAKPSQLELPEMIKNASNDTIILYLKMNVKSLTTQNQALQIENRTYSKKLKELEDYNRYLTEDRNKWIGQCKKISQELEKQVSLSRTLLETVRLSELDKEKMKKEKENLQREKNGSGIVNSKSKELQLQRSQAELVKLQEELKRLKEIMRAEKLKTREKYDNYVRTIASLERQKSELLSFVRKQMILIKNIRTQKSLQEARLSVEEIASDAQRTKYPNKEQKY